ncbi:flagellar protein [Anaeromicropila herbilytica]|uniref:Flagellar protein n=1 Tax=Anaeromicropila herbilytica TaxID=2785025 RepID=A0A7R7EPR7_9FIRM|nr:flagellar protein [Anaeromicropila herbilytica]BCN32769.1 hypothetical protein bsdtb5_40640 [Anaeromicropila herbilytica]
MEILNCRDCGKLYSYTSGPRLCPECVKKLDEKFIEVKEYIRENPGVSLYQVSEEMEVSVNQIKAWIREERLAFTEESTITIQCDSCGKEIKTGRYCKECKAKLINNLQGTYSGKESDLAYVENPLSKLRFQDNKNKR